MIGFYKRVEQKYLCSYSIKELDLVAFRFIYCTLLALQLYLDMGTAKAWYDHSAYYIPVSFLHAFGLTTKPSYGLYLVCQLTCIGALLGFAMGHWKRIFGSVSLVTFLWIHLVKYSLDAIPSSSYIWHSRNIIVFILIGLLWVDMTPVGPKLKKTWSRTRSRALFSYIAILICFSYTSPMLMRLMTWPSYWLSSEALAGYLASIGFARGDEFIVSLSLNSSAVMMMVVASTLLELGCWLMLARGKKKYIAVLFGLGFHMANHMIGFANFLSWFSFSYLIFVPYGKIGAWVHRLIKAKK